MFSARRHWQDERALILKSLQSIRYILIERYTRSNYNNLIDKLINA